ncbi:MAG: DsrE family protein [Gammaproteobacteria bacterium]|nr:DsrE family protein [Gammaproteobacteria bacterium]
MYKFIVMLALALGISTANAQDVKAVYHITTGIDTAALALYNIKNHLDADPKAKIVVVTNGAGIEFLVQDAKDGRGREFSSPVSTLAERGVEFRVCNNTLTEMKIKADKLLMEATVVPSGVAEAARLQFKERFAYIKP